MSSDDEYTVTRPWLVKLFPQEPSKRELEHLKLPHYRHTWSWDYRLDALIIEMKRRGDYPLYRDTKDADLKLWWVVDASEHWIDCQLQEHVINFYTPAA